MYIRRIRTRTHNGTDYYAFRLVESKRFGTQVKQRTLLNLGSDFSLPKAQWPTLCIAIEARLSGQQSLLRFNDDILRLAEKISSRLLPADPEVGELCPVDLGSMRHTDTRSVGGETACLHALQRLGFESLLKELGLGDKRRKLAAAQVMARMLHPSSELETYHWLEADSAALELLNLSSSKLRLGALYRVTDALYARRDAIENALYEQQCRLFDHVSTVMLYDLTNTHLTGAAHRSPGQFGRSKQKRHDCPLVTLGLSLDEAGFVRRSEVLPGNVAEPSTLANAINRLGGGSALTVVMDAGIVSDANLQWLSAAGHDWVVVDRRRPELPVGEPDVVTETAENYQVRIWRLADAEEGSEREEVRLCVHSGARELTERSMLRRARAALEKDLKYLNEGLSVPRRMKRYDKVLQKIGRLRQKHRRVSAQYDIEVSADEKQKNALQVTWSFNHRQAQRNANAGMYLLRTSKMKWDEEKIVRLYWTLSEVEATFRSLKSELGLRPVYHRTLARIKAHLFISVLAYQACHYLRLKMRSNAVRLSWKTVRRRLATLHRTSTQMNAAEGVQVRVRQNTEPNVEQRRLLSAMGVKWRRKQRIGRWPEEEKVTEVVT